jgi:hypothetical protein
MNRTWPLLTGLYAAFMVYSLLILFWGPKGQIQYGLLEEHKQVLVENVKILEKYQNDLGNETKNLQPTELPCCLRLVILDTMVTMRVELFYQKPTGLKRKDIPWVPL